MFKNPWFMLVIGVIVGLVVGYSLAEMQSVPPARTMQAPQQQGAAPSNDQQIEHHAS